MKAHGLKRYVSRPDSSPFSLKVFCGECGKPYARHVWASRGIIRWQCSNHRVNGILTCRNAYVDEKDLEKGFVLAHNKLIADNSRIKAWKNENSSPLKRLRARQLLQLSEQDPLIGMVDELAKLVLWEARVIGKKEYEFKEHGVETDSLDKKAVTELLKDASPEVAEVLKLRQQIAKSSVKKYQAMENLRCKDGRAHGCFQFAGTRTLRWAGRHIQLQNLPQNHMPDLEQARALVKAGDYDALKLLYDNIPSVLSELIRTAFVPPEGKR